MSPERLMDLAKQADPDDLCLVNPIFGVDALTPQQRRQRDTGIALRRLALHIERLESEIGAGRSLLLTPISKGVTSIKSIPTPAARAVVDDYGNEVLP